MHKSIFPRNAMPLRNTITILIAATISLACYEKAWRNRYVSTIAHAMGVIEQNYVEEVEPRELFENAMHGMVTSLDEYSDYIGPDFFEQFQQSIDQQFVGIGIVVEGPPESEALRVVSPVYDSPAYRAGMRAGDAILEIDGEPTASMTLTDAVKRIKGPPQTKVQLVIRHANSDEEITISVMRDVIRTKSVLGDTLLEDGEWNYFLEEKPHIGYVRITTFGEFSASELKEVLPFEDHAIDALILDLRGNVGGLLTAAVETSDMFIDEGLIVKTKGRNGWDDKVYYASPENTVFTAKATPIVVLADRYSASASEIVAACLKDHGRAVVAGERTWGKGTVQNVIPLEGGTSALKLTTASYWRPNDKNIHRSRKATEEDDWGVRPSPGLEVKLTEQEYQKLYEQRRNEDVLRDKDTPGTSNDPQQEPIEDPQLEKAIDYIEGLLAPATP
jgi:carboxyl-terminal processing protease